MSLEHIFKDLFRFIYIYISFSHIHAHARTHACILHRVMYSQLKLTILFLSKHRTLYRKIQNSIQRHKIQVVHVTFDSP